MDFEQSSKYHSLNKLIYINLRWIAIIGQFLTINSVKFIFNFEFNYILANFVIALGVLSNLHLTYFFKNNLLNSKPAFIFLTIDIIQLTLLLFLTGGVLNPFSVFLLIPSVFGSLRLDIKTKAKKFQKQLGIHVVEPEKKIISQHLKSEFNFVVCSLDTLLLKKSIEDMWE